MINSSQSKDFSHRLWDENLHDEVVKSLDAEVAILDREGRILEVNDCWQRRESGRLADQTEPRSVVGRDYLELLREEDAPRLQGAIEGIERVLRGRQENFLFEYETISEQRTEWYLLSAAAWHRGSGARKTEFPGGFPGAFPDSIFVTRYNVTGLKKVERSFHENQQLLGGIIGSALDAMITVDRRQRVRVFNSAAEKMFRRPAAEILDQPIEQLIPPRFRDMHRDLVEKFRAHSRNNSPMNLPGHIYGLRSNGEEFPIEASISPLEVNGETLYTVFMRDITSRLRDEEALRESKVALRDQQHLIQSIADATPNIIYLYDLRQRRFLYLNRRILDILGYHPEEVLRLAAGKFIELVHPDDIIVWQQSLERLLATRPGEKVDVELRVRHQNGHWCWLCISELVFDQDETGTPISLLGTAQDITEKKRLETQFLRAQRLESLGTLAGGIAHDLNNVLAPVLMAIQLLQMNNPDQNSQRWLSIMHGNVERGADMIRQVLLFARGSQGERMPLLLGPLVKEIVKVLRETFPKSIQIISAVDGEVWQVLGDATQLHQVLINLALNARDAMAFGGKLTIGIENRILDEEGVREHLGARIGRYVVITVADNGEGIVPENLARVFEPFFTTKEQGKGTGLGLSTVQGIIQGHEGFIDLQSEPGEGTVFRIFLPALVDSKSAESQRSYAIIPSGHGELILVVDDEESILEITKGALESFGYRVLTASDGVEAIATYAVRKDEISAVITDLMMPVMDGPATIRALLKLNPLVKIIACSGVMADANIHEATRAGAKLFLPKPFTTETLLKAVKEILG